jgi:hypothetical protein
LGKSEVEHPTVGKFQLIVAARAGETPAPSTQDPGLYIKRVVFYLHPSFNPATRVIEKAPFEVTEHGWGEFEVRAAPSSLRSRPACA